MAALVASAPRGFSWLMQSHRWVHLRMIHQELNRDLMDFSRLSDAGRPASAESLSVAARAVSRNRGARSSTRA